MWSKQYTLLKLVFERALLRNWSDQLTTNDGNKLEGLAVVKMSEDRRIFQSKP